MIGRTLSHYKILEELSRGGMGIVYRALDLKLDREVALKVLAPELVADPERKRRFVQEAKAAAKLNHPHIGMVFEIDEAEGTTFIAMELIEGEKLKDLINREQLPITRALELATEVAEGLARAHDKGIVHRDLKPANVMVSEDGHAKIIDFGLAKLVEPSSRNASELETATKQTDPGKVMGTIPYMSPEQARGQKLDHRTDIFSFGTVLYQMLTGEHPFERDSGADTLSAILNEPAPKLDPSLAEEVTQSLQRILDECLAKKATQRCQSMRQLVENMHEIRRRFESSPTVQVRTTYTTDRKTVAVLPFKDLTRDPANAHLGIGLADATITELALSDQLLVRPTAAILRYQEHTVDPDQAGRDLSVDAVVDGSFQRVGSRLRVTVQLISTQEGRTFWATKIDTSLEDIFDMQDEVSRKIAESLECGWKPREKRQPRAAGTAYELYLKGRFHLLRETTTYIQAAIECFEKASQSDPTFALAWAGLSDAYTRMAFSFEPEGDWYGQAEAMCDKALSIDPELPEGRYLRGRLVWSPKGGFGHADAIRHFVAAASYKPNLNEARAWLGIVLQHVGLLEESVRACESALAINPEDTIAFEHLGYNYYLMGDFSKAMEVLRRVEQTNFTAWICYMLSSTALHLDQIDEAEVIISIARRKFPRSVLFYPIQGLIAAIQHQGERAKQLVDRTVEKKRFYGHYHHAQYDVACIYALLGEKDSAVDWLIQTAANGFPCYPFFELDPFLESIRSESGFRTLIRNLKGECGKYQSILKASKPK